MIGVREFSFFRRGVLGAETCSMKSVVGVLS